MARVRVAALLSLAAGCAPPGDAIPVSGETAVVVGARADAIKDGYEEPSDTSVVAIVNTNGTLCSGTLLTPNLVLTARHCVSPVLEDAQGVLCDKTRFGATHAPGSFFVSTASEVTLGNAGEFFVEAVVPLSGYPGIPAFNPDDEGFCGNDVAVLLLAETVPSSKATPREPSFAPLDAATVFSAIGYGGIDNEGEGAGTRRRRDDLSVTCVGLACEGDFVEPGEIRVEEWGGTGGVCQGDSGGPALDDAGAVLGVASRGDYDCTLSIYADVAPYQSWLANVAAYASGLGQYDAPAWAAGATVDPEIATPIGDACTTDADCPSGRCFDDGTRKYCTRKCQEETAPCPSGEDWVCVSQPTSDEGLCVEYIPPPPPPPPSYQRNDPSGCSMGAADDRRSDGGSWWWLLVVALASRRRRCR